MEGCPHAAFRGPGISTSIKAYFASSSRELTPSDHWRAPDGNRLRNLGAAMDDFVDDISTGEMTPVIKVAGANLLTRFQRDQSGSYLVISAVLMPVLVGLVGLGTDYGVWLGVSQRMQAAADAAAFSAATLLTNNSGGDATTQADAIASSFGFTDGLNGVTVTVNKPPGSGPHIATAGAVEVIIQQPQRRFFSAMIFPGSVAVAARSVALSGNNGLGCVLSLNPTASGAITLQGTSDVTLGGCTLYDNSSSGSALTVGGSATLSALAVDVVGGISGKSSITASNGVTTSASSMADPYSSASYDPYSGCTYNNYTAKNTVTLSPGVFCNGLSLNAGANVTLQPGTYYIDRGGLSVNGGATLTGDGVTLVFTSSTGNNYANATINGGATVNLTAPTTGPTAGIVIFGDRNMSEGTSFKFNGGASQVFSGAIYVPEAAAQFAGGANTSKACTQLVANTITFTGNANFAINCSGSGTKPIGSSTALLVE
jgi:Flp pilus assembly protein TadG